MDAEGKAVPLRRRRRWHSRRSRSTSNRSSTMPSRAVNSMNSARKMTNIPPYSGYNIVDWHIYNRLTSLWKTESQSWSESERRDFVEWVPKARVTERENAMLDHPLADHMRQCNAPSWGHFVILRVMFGASVCARQSWWANFKERYDRAGEDAPPGVVPGDVDEILRTNRMRAPAVVKIPTMEVDDGVYGERDCGCGWCLKKKADKASRGSTSSSPRTAKTKQGEKEKCPRGESIFTGEGETWEDRARRFEREQGVEPEEAQDDDDDEDDDGGDESEEDEVTGVVTQASSLQERSTLVCTDGANRSLREVVVEQGSMIETLVRLVERQHERMGRLERRVNGV
ncbi:hypothetical protein Trisim1_011239 [Trichoderma cf. simile WF8]